MAESPKGQIKETGGCPVCCYGRRARPKITRADVPQDRVIFGRASRGAMIDQWPTTSKGLRLPVLRASLRRPRANLRGHVIPDSAASQRAGKPPVVRTGGTHRTTEDAAEAARG